MTEVLGHSELDRGPNRFGPGDLHQGGVVAVAVAVVLGVVPIESVTILHTRSPMKRSSLR